MEENINEKLILIFKGQWKLSRMTGNEKIRVEKKCTF
jgi:hypothetical protein